jgi:signal transduction histidine kinase
MSNSVKYSDAAKDACWLQVELEVNKERALLIFNDNGKGISAENQSRVFDMFYRGTSERSGSGLGLYIVKEMTERIGGTILLESELGFGTTIRVELPNFIGSQTA